MARFYNLADLGAQVCFFFFFLSNENGSIKHLWQSSKSKVNTKGFESNHQVSRNLAWEMKGKDGEIKWRGAAGRKGFERNINTSHNEKEYRQMIVNMVMLKNNLWSYFSLH